MPLGAKRGDKNNKQENASGTASFLCLQGDMLRNERRRVGKMSLSCVFATTGAVKDLTAPPRTRHDRERH